MSASSSSSFVHNENGLAKGFDEIDKTYQDLLVWIELEKNIFERKMRLHDENCAQEKEMCWYICHEDCYTDRALWLCHC